MLPNVVPGEQNFCQVRSTLWQDRSPPTDSALVNRAFPLRSAHPLAGIIQARNKAETASAVLPGSATAHRPSRGCCPPEELHNLLWPAQTIVDFELGVNTCIKKLCGILSDSASQPRYIETLPKLGYRLIVPVEVAESGGQAKEGTALDWPRQKSRAQMMQQARESRGRYLHGHGGCGGGRWQSAVRCSW
jgi:hypothetical protein